MTYRPRESTTMVVRRWLTAPHDFDWIFLHHSTRPIHGLIRSVFAGATLLYAVTALLMIMSPNGPQGPYAIGWNIVIFAIQAVLVVYMLVGPVPDRKYQFVILLVFGDVGITSVILLDVPTSAMIGTFLFAINGALCTFFLSPRILIAHIVFSNAVIILIGYLAYAQDLWGVWDASAAVLVAIGSTSSVPLFASIAWFLVSSDAKVSDLDSLTGLLNRRGLQNAVDDLWAVALERSAPVVVFMVDIDRFKSVNDRYGHEQGDTVIKLMADRLSTLFDGRGVIARTGGEEFVMVMTDLDNERDAIANQVNAKVNDADDTIPVTASVGVAVLTTDSPLWSSGPTAIERATRGADSMMYRAKAAGGHRTLVTHL
ncbi:MAG: GGDEF domain-containing protein [Rhodococcus sp. (in: high G+C Gram-positive bacteria)]